MIKVNPLFSKRLKYLFFTAVKIHLVFLHGSEEEALIKVCLIYIFHFFVGLKDSGFGLVSIKRTGFTNREDDTGDWSTHQYSGTRLHRW